MTVMTDILKYYIYSFYPKGIENPFDDEYLSSEEYLTLKYVMDKARQWDMTPVLKPLMELEDGVLTPSPAILDLTNFNLGDRCFHVQYKYRIENRIEAISVNISILAPVFCVYHILRDQIDQVTIGKKIANPEAFFKHDFNDLPARHVPLINAVSSKLGKCGYTQIPNERLPDIIPDIAFETIGLGQMTLYNALFMNEPYCSL
jgi:hypothetical protein